MVEIIGKFKSSEEKEKEGEKRVRKFMEFNEGLYSYEKEPAVKVTDEREFYDFIGKPISELVEFVIKKYGNEFTFPGLEYEEYLNKNPDKVPQELKNGDSEFPDIYYLLGSTLRGNTKIPYMYWKDNLLTFYQEEPDYESNGYERFVLFHK